ncbi:MAG TPA: glycosyltransferase family 2 protein [Chloroflexota bacterium]|jgi:glycosyltransferase involved in cell wall biosynthesis
MAVAALCIAAAAEFARLKYSVGLDLAGLAAVLLFTHEVRTQRSRPVGPNGPDPVKLLADGEVSGLPTQWSRTAPPSRFEQEGVVEVDPLLAVRRGRTVIVMPAYNAAKTLERTYTDLPPGLADDVILVDDHSVDNTVEVARALGLKVICHERNLGYGGNQKTCYTAALARGAEIIVMLHPDHQYDPKAIPDLIRPLVEGRADAVFGSRMLGGKCLEGGMPTWKFDANVVLTAVANISLKTFLTEFHSGFRAYSRRYLKAVNYQCNSNDFVFDTEIIIQGLHKGLRIHEVPIQTRYFEEASQIGFPRSVRYGLSILATLLAYQAHRKGMIQDKRFA